MQITLQLSWPEITEGRKTERSERQLKSNYFETESLDYFSHQRQLSEASFEKQQLQTLNLTVPLTLIHEGKSSPTTVFPLSRRLPV